MHKFHGDPSRLDSPRRREVMPVETIIDALGEIAEGIKVADIGCGTGYLTIPLAQRIGGHGTVYALDINPEMLAIVRERAAGLDNVEVLESGENSLPIPDGAIDASFLVTVWHELQDPEAFLREVGRVSGEHHKVIVVDWATEEIGDMGPPLEERIPADEVIWFFKERGYALIKRFAPSKYIYGVVFTPRK